MVAVALAQQFFSAQHAAGNLQQDVEEEIIRILGKDPDDADTWGFDDITHDSYDSSFELKSCREPIPTLTEAQRQAFKDLGYQQCWFCTKPAGVYDPGIHIWF